MTYSEDANLPDPADSSSASPRAALPDTGIFPPSMTAGATILFPRTIKRRQWELFGSRESSSH
jgi:hypothetical protein